MLIGYARVSTHDQILDLQVDALKKAGCEKILTDSISGAKAHRPGLDKALELLRAGDTLVVWRLDRLGRSLRDLIELINKLHDMEVGFQSLQESMDTNTSVGKLSFHVFGALAEFERNLIRDRTNAGLAAARARGRVGGRPMKLKAGQLAIALKLYEDKSTPIKDILKTVGISKATLYSYIRKSKVPPPIEVKPASA